MLSRIMHFSSKEELVVAVSNYVKDVIQQSIAQHGECRIALSGGKTPEAFYERLATLQVQAIIPWRRVHLFWGDERAVPPQHPDSNYKMVKNALLQHIPIPDENVHRIRGELEPHQAAKEYAAELQRHFDVALPRFDLVILGVGTDGHTASLFPGTPIVEEKDKTVCEVFVPILGSWRISLTLPVINNAITVLFAATGKNKSEILKKIFTLKKPSLTIPASHVKPKNGKLLWM
ncbi:MAG: 6-phosphogluconolactonase, partial [Calditrichia bacterium]